MVGRVGGQVSDYNATGGPNGSAEAELMISRVGQFGPGVAKFSRSSQKESMQCFCYNLLYVDAFREHAF